MAKEKIDMIVLQLINNFLYSLVDEMTQTVVRTSFSPLIRDAFDFQCAICRADGDVILEGEGISVYSMVYPNLIKDWMKEHADITYPGDTIITNDPYAGGSHLPDFHMYHPIFVGDKLVAWTCSGGHMKDIGGSVYGSCACDSTDIFQEGLRIPPMKLYERGVRNETLFEIMRAMSRTPDILLGDTQVWQSSCLIGERRFMELVKTYGSETLKVYFDELIDYAERLTRAEIKAMPDGEYEFTDYLDDGGTGYVDAEGNVISDLVPIHVKITVKGDSIAFDFTGTAPQVKGAMNNPYGTTIATALCNLRLILNPDIPRNSGTMRPLTLIYPHGTLLHPKLPGAVAGRGATFGRMSDAVQGAEAQLAPDKMLACPSNIDTLLAIGGHDETGTPFVFMETIFGGWGGRPFADGIDYNTIPVFNYGNQPCEVNEELFPLMCNQYAYTTDREGAGKHRGSVALIREWKLLVDEAILQLRTDRQRTAPYGLYGGESGTCSESIINPDTENRHIGKTTIGLKKGDIYRVITSGAGGWGDPLERDPELVLRDVRDEKVSAKRAREAYGVVINEAAMEIDVAETEKLRKQMKEEKNSV